MSLLNQLGITTNSIFNSTLGSVLQHRMYKNYIFTNDDIQKFIDEGLARRFVISNTILAKLSKFLEERPILSQALGNVECTGIIDGIDFEVQVASYYINKVESSKKRNIPFELTLSQVRKLMQRKTCFYTKVKFIDRPGQPNSRTLDRIDSTKGYTVANTVACTFSVNQVKNCLFENPSSNALIDMQSLKTFINTYSEILERQKNDTII